MSPPLSGPMQRQKRLLNQVKKMTPLEAVAWLRSIGEYPPPLSRVHMNVVGALKQAQQR